ncbi:MAG: protein-disulfide reductase DsbD family protein [Planctomycetota bacterium]|jgi:thiol:disulfide interchange protein DsbD|nr:protein-disulfide reductase DsbD family protein [Planctomycetota bacterium]
MNPVRIWIPILALLLPLLACPLPAQDALDAVQVQTTTDPTSAAPGQTIHIVITFDVAPGYHIFSVDSDFGMAMTFQLESGGTLGPAIWPPSHVIEDEVLGNYEAHEGTIEVKLPYTLPQETALGKPLQIQIAIAGQTCNEEGCFPIDRILSTATIEVVANSTAPDPPQPTSTETAPAETAPEDPSENPSQGSAELLDLIVPSILLGLLTLIMPCTYPMIPITITIFTKGEGGGWGTSLLRGLVYGAGIVVAYTAVGLAFDVLLGSTAAGQQKIQQFATNPWVNLAIGGLFLYFAGSFFGFYDIWLPGIVQRGASQGQAKVLGGVTLPGLFLLGSLFMITSYSCGAPFVFALFTKAAQAPSRFAVTFALFIFSSTLALPFVLLALLPGLLKTMPGSGSWMSAFKVTMGFLEVAFALKFLSNTDIAMGNGWPILLTREVFLLLWVAISALIIFYLLGGIRFPHDSEVSTIGGGRALWIGLFLFLLCYLAGGLLGSPMGGALEGFLPPVKKAEASSNGPNRGIAWIHNWEEAKEAAAKSNKNLLINFTGHY